MSLRQFWNNINASDEVVDFCEQRVNGVLDNLATLDATIIEHSDNWRLDRMTAVDRNILRMALFEILHCPEIPKNVVINEAVEIGKKYGTEDSGAFVNGILDCVANEAENLKQADDDPVAFTAFVERGKS